MADRNVCPTAEQIEGVFALPGPARQAGPTADLAQESDTRGEERISNIEQGTLNVERTEKEAGR